MTENSLELFKEIQIRKPTDLIIEQIRNLIASGVLKPGMKLPPERALAEKFKVGRGYIREAIKKLEFYGILKTIPKRGTIVSSLGVKALEGLISNILGMEEKNVENLLETRAILEIHTARMAARRGTEEDFREILKSHEEFQRKVTLGGSTLEEDHVFHLTIGHAAHNSITNSLIGLIIPDVIIMNRDYQEIGVERKQTIEEHRAVLEAIFERDALRAAEAMRHHMEMAHRRRFPEKEPEWL
ncbi:MAG TPA: FadR/GntR family transcriptional regulator [Spirochaetales bacterium]|nr:FadR/GntR family transcriptional regulator [Spirochaetales bacterium]